MPLYALNILGSRRHANVLAIMEETGTHIYLPSPWTKSTAAAVGTTQPSSLFNASATTTAAESESIIHVTGNTTEAVQRATMLLAKALPQKVVYMKTDHSYQKMNSDFFID